MYTSFSLKSTVTVVLRATRYEVAALALYCGPRDVLWLLQASVAYSRSTSGRAWSLLATVRYAFDGERSLANIECAQQSLSPVNNASAYHSLS